MSCQIRRESVVTSSKCPALCAIETHGSPPRRGEAAARGGTAQSVGHPPLAPPPRVGGLVARKPIARRHRWEAVHLRQRRPHSPLAHRNRDDRKGNTSMTDTPASAATRADRIRE